MKNYGDLGGCYPSMRYPTSFIVIVNLVTVQTGFEKADHN